MAQPFPVVKGKYIAGRPTKAAGSRLSAHVKYNQYRKLGEQETREGRFLFDQENDHVSRQDAVYDVMTHTSSKVLYHKIILSPGEHEHIDDFRQWTRDAMRNLEEQTGIHLHWSAVVQAHEQEHTNKPRMHLVLAGSAEHLTTGTRKTVTM